MAATVTNNIVMKMVKENAKTKKMTIEGYRETLTDNEIMDSADGIIEDNIFIFDGLSLIGVDSVERVDTYKTPVVRS